MGNFPFQVPSLGDKFIDYRHQIPGDSFNWSWVRPLSQPQYLVIHHSAGPDTQTPDEIALFHVNVRGWGGVGYHFIINPEGVVYYVGDLTTARANVKNMNQLVIGICLIGNFINGQEPTDLQLRSAHELCAQLLFRTPELSGVTSWQDIRGHQQLGQTACPGQDWNSWRQQLINITPPENNPGRSQDIINLYHVVLGREPDQSGFNFYFSGKMTIDQIRKAMVESPEHQQLLRSAYSYKNSQSAAGESLQLLGNAYQKITQVLAHN